MAKVQEFTQETASDAVKAISSEIIADNKAMNKLLEKVEDKAVRVHFGTHYVDVKRNVHGMEQLLVSIMSNANAIVSDTSARQEILDKGLLFSEIEKRFRQKAGSALNRYGKQSVYTYLIQKMPYVVKYQMTSAEDSERTSRKPRVRYALLSGSIPTFAEAAQIDFADENEEC
jgi:hypothetical protein